jgi:hypothetical protein
MSVGLERYCCLCCAKANKNAFICELSIKTKLDHPQANPYNKVIKIMAQKHRTKTAQKYTKVAK